MIRGGCGVSMMDDALLEALLLQNYNTRLVVLSTTLLGIASGMIGSFMLLRKRALMGDALSHATLPGVVLAFLVMQTHSEDGGKWLPGLLLGAALFGVLGFLSVQAIREHTRIKDDAAMAIVLSVFFGGGVALLGIAQSLPNSSSAGLETFIYGKVASMLLVDFWLLAGVTLAVIFICLLFYKEFQMVCFDESFAAAAGWPVAWVDRLMLSALTLVTVAGLQSVGLLLVIAFLITPAAAARQWTHQLRWMLLLAMLFGGLSGWLGSTFSAALPNMPAGAVIVLAGTCLFVVSSFVGTDRGWLVRVFKERRLRRKVAHQHILRALYEAIEQSKEQSEESKAQNSWDETISWERLLQKRSWSKHQLEKAAWWAYRHALLERPGSDGLRFTKGGLEEAWRITRNHRLWEMYLIEFADIAPSHVDRDADTVEHVLGRELTHELEKRLGSNEPEEGKAGAMPKSPHELKD